MCEQQLITMLLICPEQSVIKYNSHLCTYFITSLEALNDWSGQCAKEENYAGGKKANGPLLLKMRQKISRKNSGPSTYINILTLGKLKTL